MLLIEVAGRVGYRCCQFIKVVDFRRGPVGSACCSCLRLFFLCVTV